MTHLSYCQVSQDLDLLGLTACRVHRFLCCILDCCHQVEIPVAAARDVALHSKYHTCNVVSFPPKTCGSPSLVPFTFVGTVALSHRTRVASVSRLMSELKKRTWTESHHPEQQTADNTTQITRHSEAHYDNVGGQVEIRVKEEVDRETTNQDNRVIIHLYCLHPASTGCQHWRAWTESTLQHCCIMSPLRRCVAICDATFLG